MIAALFVQRGGCYFGLPDVDPWDEARDARLYAGPHPVIAHPPCARWGRLAGHAHSRGAPAPGEDGGCFASALASVRKWGGVLEHPAWSAAWPAHGLPRPPAFGWARDLDGSWSCEVSQGYYGHRADKLTWLYYVGELPPTPLRWGRPTRQDGPWMPCMEDCGEWWCTAHGAHVFECPCQPVEEWSTSPYAAERTSKGRRRGVVETMTRTERAATPPAFRDVLLDIARSCRRSEAA